jgi:hypothetical protein
MALLEWSVVGVGVALAVVLVAQPFIFGELRQRPALFVRSARRPSRSGPGSESSEHSKPGTKSGDGSGSSSGGGSCHNTDEKEDSEGSQARNVPTVAPISPVRRIVGVVCLLGVFVVCMVLCGLICNCGIVQTAEGRDRVIAWAARWRTDLVSVAVEARGLVWSLCSGMLSLFWEMPLLAVGAHADRATLFRLLNRCGAGHAVGFRDSFLVFDHASVVQVLSSPEQSRGHYIGASPMPDRCMAADTLIFLSSGSGSQHDNVRSFLLANVPAWLRPMDEPLVLDTAHDNDDADAVGGTVTTDPQDRDARVRRAIVRTVYREMFEADITDEVRACYNIVVGLEYG